MSVAPPFIVFRCDASTAMGTGHVRRCLSLATALHALGARCAFVVRTTDLDTAAMIQGAGFEAFLLPSLDGHGHARGPGSDAPHRDWLGTTPRQDAADTLQAVARAGGAKPDWVVADHYAIDAEWHDTVRSALQCRMAAIDDLADRSLDVDLLIDHNLHPDHRGRYASCIGASTRILGGPRFALLGPAYAGLIPRQLGDAVDSLGIFMGGVDADDLASLALLACRDHARFMGDIEIVATGTSLHLDKLRELTSRYPRTRLSIDLPDLAAFLVRHDLQIGAGGGASWERCRAGAPMLILQVAANQQGVVSELVRAGAAATLPEGQVPTPMTVGRAVAELIADSSRRHALSGRARDLVDGLGAHRVAVALMADGLELRAATADDADQSFAWRNDPSTRRHSRDPRELDPGQHRSWWQAAVKDPARRLFIAHVGDRDVGVLRLDIQDIQAEVSIYLDPALTGLGMGPWLLRAAQQWVRRHAKLERLVATILPANRASARAFIDAGFVFQDPLWVWPVRPPAASTGTNSRGA